MPPKPFDVNDIPLLALPSVPFDARKNLPRCAAIYFVLNPSGVVLYIGRSVNLAVRWRGHHQLRALGEQQASRIAWLVMENTDLLTAVEAACIAYFQPTCNGGSAMQGRPRMHPGGTETMIFRFPSELAQQLRARAEKEDRSINAVVFRLLQMALRIRME